MERVARYGLARLAAASAAAAGALRAGAEPSSALAAALAEARRPLTRPLRVDAAAARQFGGPLLPPGGSSAASIAPSAAAVLLRRLPGAAAASVEVQDVVAIDVGGTTLLRRVAATEGAEMVSDDADDEGFVLPAGHCWVTVDAEGEAAVGSGATPQDSRAFGPLPYTSILGRAIYAVRSAVDHGPVQNSAAASAADAAVLESELCVSTLVAAC